MKDEECASRLLIREFLYFCVLLFLVFVVHQYSR